MEIVPNVTPEPDKACMKCVRLAEFRMQSQRANPHWFNGAVASFGSETARLLVVGLAPGLQGANRTGRPFTGDYAGELLYQTLADLGFSSGTYAARPDDGLQLIDCMITNAVRCVPPQNKPTAAEIKTCGTFLAARIASLLHLKAIVALGRIAHDATLVALGQRKSQFQFAHGASHPATETLRMFDSYHCSRYNTNTGRLTPEMFADVFCAAKQYLDRH